MEAFEKSEFENIERNKYHCVYTDGKVLGCQVIFECDATDMLDADEKFHLFITDNNIDISESEIRRSAIVI